MKTAEEIARELRAEAKRLVALASAYNDAAKILDPKERRS